MSLSRPDHSLDGQSTSEMTIALSAALGFLCTVVVGARLYTRAILLRNAGRDDVSIVITQVRPHAASIVDHNPLPATIRQLLT